MRMRLFDIENFFELFRTRSSSSFRNKWSDRLHIGHWCLVIGHFLVPNYCLKCVPQSRDMFGIRFALVIFLLVDFLERYGLWRCWCWSNINRLRGSRSRYNNWFPLFMPVCYHFLNLAFRFRESLAGMLFYFINIRDFWYSNRRHSSGRERR